MGVVWHNRVSQDRDNNPEIRSYIVTTITTTIIKFMFAVTSDHTMPSYMHMIIS